jgi:maleate isomerase
MSGADTRRCRVGLLVPSSNTVMEPDFYRGLPEWATLHTGRMFLEDTTADGERRMLEEFTMPAAEALGTVHPDVVVFGCTSAGALRGDAADRKLCARIAEATGADTVSVIASLREAIQRQGARRVGVLTPYVEELNRAIKASIETAGVEVHGITGLGIDENVRIAEVTPAQIVEFARVTFGGAPIDSLVVSCTNFRALEALPALSDAMGVPVVTSNQAALEAVLARIGAEPAVPGVAAP